MPQPKAGRGGRNDDIIVRAMVGYDGRVYDLAVQSSEREDLNAEALDVAKRWTFTPSMCDGLLTHMKWTLHYTFRVDRRLLQVRYREYVPILTL